MFKNNKYTTTYFNIIMRASQRPATKKAANKLFGYVEKHHIIPKSMGGSDDKANLVFLTAKEHFIAHMLLVKMVIDNAHLNSMRFALWKFNQRNKQQDRKTLTSWEYEYLKRNVAIASSEMNTGKVMKKWTDEQKLAMSVARKGVPSPLKGSTLSQATKDKISAKHKGRVSPTKGNKLKTRTATHIANHAAARTGKPGRTGVLQTDETKAKISKANTGRIPWNKKTPSVITPLAASSPALLSDAPASA